MIDIAELVVAGLGAVAVNLVMATVAVLCVTMVPVVRRALGTVHEACCRIVGGGYGFVGHARPRRRPRAERPSG